MVTEKTSIENCNVEEVLNDESFVGIYFNKGKFDIKFPLGYKLEKVPPKEDAASYKKYQLQKRKDVITLIHVLSHYKQTLISPKEINKKLEENIYNFPLYAYIQIYNYYMSRGYYIPKKNIYKKSNSGKINWNRTIKQIDPIVCNNSVIYLDTIRNKINYNENEFISILNRYCVYQSFLKIGCLFTSKMVKKENLPAGVKVCIRFLANKIKNTFNTDEINLFKNMKTILETESNDNNNQEYYFGTTSFHTVWESMVDDFFGETAKIKKQYNPELQWYDYNGYEIHGQDSNLRPDTIAFKYENGIKKVFILDSKYYKGSVNLTEGHLPLSESVPKQLVYADWAITEMGNEGHNVFNAFIMPDDLTNDEKASKVNNLTIRRYGFIRPKWLKMADFKNPEKPYNRIQGIKIDTKDLMQNYARKNSQDFNQLLSLIEKEANDLKKY